MNLKKENKHLKQRISELENELMKYRNGSDTQKPSISPYHHENKYKLVFDDNDPDIKLLIDPNTGRILDANRTAVEFYGYSGQKLTSMSIYEINVLSEKEVNQQMELATYLKKNFFEFRHRLANGEIKDVEVYSLPVEHQNKRLLYSVLRDVTAKREVESSLKESRELNENILKASSVGMAFSKNRKIIWANETMEEMFGYSPGEYQNADTRLLYPSDEEYERIGKLVYQNQLSGKPLQFKAQFKRKNGTEFPGFYKINFIDPENHEKGLIVSIIDISELVQTENKLKRRNKAIESSIDGIAMLDQQQKYVFVNAAMASMFAYSNPAEIVGKYWKILYGKDEVKRFEKQILPSFRKEKAWRGEAIGTRKNGETFPIEVSLTSLDDSDMICLVRDISERKEAEQTVEKSRQKADFLSRTAMDLINMKKTVDVYDYAAEKLYGLIGENGLVTIIEFNDVLNTWAVRKVIGFGKLGRKMQKLLGFNISDLSGEISTRFYHKLSRGKLHKIPFDFPAFTSGRISQTSGQALKKLLGARSLHAITFSRNNRTLGAVNIALKDKDLTSGRDTVEAFMAQVSVVIEKLGIQEQLADSLQEKKIIEANIPNVIWKTDVDGDRFVNTYISDSMDELLGLPSGTIDDDWKKYYEFVKPEYIPLIKSELNKAASNPGTTVGIEYEIVKANGETAWLQSAGRAYDEQGVIRIYGYTSDITGRRKADKALEESEDKYHNIFLNAPMGIFHYDVNGVITDCNEPFVRIIGSSKEALIGMDMFKTLNNKQIIACIKQSLSEGLSHYEDWYESVTADKRTYVKILFKGLRDSQGKIVAGVALIEDVTESKKAESENQKLMHAIEQSPATIVITDQDGNIEYTNPAFTEITGYTSEEVKGQNPRILKTDKYPVGFHKELWNTISSGKNWIGEFRNKKKNGDIYWESATISPVINNKGIITNYIAIKQDITESKKSEKELIRAKEKAEESDRLKSAFLATMSHELRTPLNAIIGFSDLIMGGDLSQEQVLDYIEPINSSGKHLLEIIEDLFDISTLETGESEVKKKQFSIQVLFGEIGKTIQNELTKRQKSRLDIRYIPPQNTGKIEIFSDKGKIKRVLVNFLNNAIKFTHEGSIEYGYRTEGEDLILMVKDTGIGIPKDKQEMIFERFRQVEEARATREYEGIGLGLSICKKIADLLDGKLWVESESGKGSTFFFRLNNVVLVEERKTNTKATLSGVAGSSLRGKTLLIAEDEESNMLLMKTVLSTTGAKLHFAKNGKEAVDQFRKYPEINLVLMDIKMPEMDGFAATKEIHKTNPDMPVIALTAFAFETDREKALAAGCVDYLSKPVKVGKLIEKIKQHMSVS